MVYCYASGIFSSRRIEQASYRNVSVRFIAANSHPDHDTIAKFRRDNGAAFAAAFAQILLLARELNILKVGMVSVDGTKIDANASKIKSLRYDRIEVLRAKLEADIADLVQEAEAADRAGAADGLSLPDEIARRQSLKDKLDAAAKRLEAAAKGKDDNGDDPDPSRDADDRDGPAVQSGQANQSDRPRQRLPSCASQRGMNIAMAYNAQAIVDADGSALILRRIATNVLSTTNDRQDLDALGGGTALRYRWQALGKRIMYHALG